MNKTFLGFVIENMEAKKTPYELKLANDTDSKPLIIDADHNPNLRIILKAFLDSPNVNLPGPDGYPQKLTTIDAKGTTNPKLKKKSLYLVGNAVTEHLLDKKITNYDLTTDAHPDEVKLILRHAKFIDCKTQDCKGTKKFFPKDLDRTGKEFSLRVEVNGQEFTISTFRKNPKTSDNKTDSVEFSNLDDDAKGRDFTSNAMYIQLTNADGPNNKLIDPHAGLHHLRNKEIHWIGNAKEKLGEDQLRAMKYIQQIAAYGQNTKITDEIKSAIDDVKDLSNVSREQMKKEFLNGLHHKDIDPQKYVKLYKDTGLLNTIFPNVEFKLDAPDDFSDKKETRLAIAWLLRNNPIQKIQQVLTQGKWEQKEIEQIIHLIEISKWLSEHKKNPQIFFDKFLDMKKNLTKSGLVPSLVKSWAKMNKHPENIVNHFTNHTIDTPGFTNSTQGLRTINPDIIKLLGKIPQGPEFTQAIKHLETEKFKNKIGDNG